MNKSFNWANFDASFLKSILNSTKSQNKSRPTFDSDESFELASFVDGICYYPDRKFVIDYRNEIDFHFLKHNPELVCSVFGDGKDNPNSLLLKITALPLGEILINKYLTALFRIGCNDADLFFSEYTNPVTIDLTKTRYIDVPLYDFQKEAIDKLNNFATKSNRKSGLLVMPTGSGKTRTAVYFLLSNMVSQGYQVIWLTHRHMLIDQAAEQFQKMSGLVAVNNPNAKTLCFMCASGKHGTIKSASKKQNVMILSVQTAVRNLPYLRKSLGSKVIIVVDEAHHTVASSYKKIISDIRKRCPDTMLLGLTATPIRYTDTATAQLYQVFEKNIIYSIDMNRLIADGTLAKPEFYNVSTNIDFEPGITYEEAKKIDRYGELPESVINRIAQSKHRNEIIIEQYLKHDYGKTLIFALNIIHAQMLYDELKKRKVNCECIYSGKNDNEAIIAAFKNNNIDVLINVNILSEGSDLPNVETVFLTRPTQSETLLVQMIGRGMRGKKAGGTKSVKIIDFIDKWDTFSQWLNPEFIFNDVAFENDSPESEAAKKERIIIPWSDIRAIYRSLNSGSSILTESQNIPLGWFCLDADEKPYTLLVFENQIAGYTELFRNKKEIIADESITATEIRSRCFSNTTEKPSISNIDALLEHLRSIGYQPHLNMFKERNKIEPYKVAQFIKESGKDLFAVCSEKYEQHKEMIDQFYGNLEEYRKYIFNIINYNDTQDNQTPAEMPAELISYDLDKPHDLQALYNEVKVEMAEHLGDCVHDTGEVYWSEKPDRKIFGKFSSNTGNIEINCVLNSSKVPREVIKYLLYHEMLHRKYYRHDTIFRQIEHKYPDYTSHETFLDYEFNKFDITY